MVHHDGGRLYCLKRFFFFQAEDGIRDKLVTGVQTCALPIYPVLLREQTGAPGDPAHEEVQDDEPGPVRRAAKEGRSEERRVGKSVDLGGRRIIKKKKSEKSCG